MYAKSIYKDILKILKGSLYICGMLLLISSCKQSQSTYATKSNDFRKDSSAHYNLYAQAGVRSEHNLKEIGQRLEQVQDELLQLLHENKFQNLELYFLKDRETLTTYTNFPAKAYTDTKNGIIYFVDKAPFNLAFRHEIMHAISWRLWGPPKGYWLSEGIAVFSSGNCAGYPLHSLARAIEQQGKLTPFENLTDSFDFSSLEPSLQAASMVQYIYDNYGVTALKGFWEGGWKNSQQVIGIPPHELQKRWLSYIQQPVFELPIQWSKILDSGCE